MIRATLDHYPERVAIGEVGVRNAARFARYVRQDELHLAFDTRLAASRFDAEEVRAAIEDCLNAVGSVGAAASWLLSDHDVSRAGLALRRRRRRACAGPGDGAGAARAARRGLPLQRRGAGAARRRPARRGPPRRRVAPRTKTAATAAGCRMPWEGRPPGYGFTTGEPWLPMPRRLRACSAPPSSSRTPAPRCRSTGARWSCAVSTRASRRPRRRPRAGVVRRPARLPGLPAGRARRWCAR